MNYDRIDKDALRAKRTHKNMLYKKGIKAFSRNFFSSRSTNKLLGGANSSSKISTLSSELLEVI